MLRYTKPNMPRSFRTPGAPLVPLIGVILCIYLMTSLPLITWYSFGVWTFIGVIIYFGYSRYNSVLGKSLLAL